MKGLNRQLLHTADPEGADGTVELFAGHLDGSLSWADLLPPDSVCFCFNDQGEALILAESTTRLYLRPQSLSLFATRSEPLVTATRIGPGRHRFVTVSIPRNHLARAFGDGQSALHPEFRRLLVDRSAAAPGVVRPMWSDEKTLLRELCEPPVPPGARDLWYRSKIGELLALHLFMPAREPFCVQQRRRTNVFVDRALAHLRSHYQEPMELETLAGVCGCSGPYLSRIMKRETGHTLQQHLRTLRIDGAARLLAAGANVTEAAFEVGYSSLSHFSKAFVAEKGLLPSEFLRQAG